MIHDVTIPIRSYLNTAPNGVRIIYFFFFLFEKPCQRETSVSKRITCAHFAEFSRGEVF